METLVRINYIKRFNPYEDDEKWVDLNNQYSGYKGLKFEISEHGDLSIVIKIKNVFSSGITGKIIRKINLKAQGVDTSLPLPCVQMRKFDMQGSDIIDIYYDPELSCEDIGKYFLDRDCHNVCVIMHFKMYDVATKKEKRGYIELRDRIMSLFKPTLYDDNSIAVIESNGDNFVRDKIKKIFSLYMCEIDRNNRTKTIDRYYGFGDIINYAFMQDDNTYVSIKII